MADQPLGRIPPSDMEHEEKYPLTASTTPRKPTPVVLGTNWYEGMDKPRIDADGYQWIEISRLVRGGHSYVLKPPAITDSKGWYSFYNQKNEGACVAFASMRMMSLLNRCRYDAWRGYEWMQANDEFASTPPAQGTSVRAGMDFLRKHGPYRVRGGGITGPLPQHGILENRWCKSMRQIAACLHPSDGGDTIMNQGYVEVLNSWGENYPRLCRMSLETLDRLVFQEEGEATLVTDL